MYCHGFTKEKQYKVILTCHSAHVSYYLYKCFVIVETKEGVLDKVPSNVKEQFNTVNRRDNESVFTCKT